MNHNDADIYERVRHLANVAVWSINLQARRIRDSEPEDAQFVFRRWMDYHYLIIALSRLRETAQHLLSIVALKDKMQPSIEHFEAEFPWLRDLRNVVAHFDEYPIGKGKNKELRKEGMEVATIGTDCLRWLNFEIRPEQAVKEGAALFHAIQTCAEVFTSASAKKQK